MVLRKQTWRETVDSIPDVVLRANVKSSLCSETKNSENQSFRPKSGYMTHFLSKKAQLM